MTIKFRLHSLFLFLSIELLSQVSCLTLDSYLFAPSQSVSYARPLNIIPNNFIESVKFLSGVDTLYGFYVKSGSVERQKKSAIIYFHGNLKNIDEYWSRFQLLHELGFNLFIFDYRGYGMSQGVSLDENTILEDSKAALDYVVKKKRISEDSLLLYGFSLGCVPALYLATNSEYSSKFPALILEAPFSSANSLVQGSAGLPIPNGWLNKTNFDNSIRVKEWKKPFLVFGALNDSTSRFRDNAKVVFENSNSIKKKLIVTESGHSHIINKLTKKVYVDTLRAWLNEDVLPYKLK